MSKALKARFDGNIQEVIEYARTWGIFKAMENYQVHDYLAFKRFLEEETGDQNFGLSPIIGGEMGRSWAEDLLDAMLNKICKMEAEKKLLKSEMQRLNLKLEYIQGIEARRIEPKIQEVLARCRI